MDKGTLLFSFAIAFLLAAIAGGIWFINGRQVPSSSHNAPKQTTSFTMDEVARHSSKEDCWTVISGEVYNLTDFISRHPGGDEILRACGMDATELFASRRTEGGRPAGTGTPHSQTAHDQLAGLRIGTIDSR